MDRTQIPGSAPEEITGLPNAFQVVDRVSFGTPGADPNRLYLGDCLQVMRHLPSEEIDLIYIDPPFFSGRDRSASSGDRNDGRSFSDIWEFGLEGYLVWLTTRLLEMKRLLTPSGSIVVHLDWHASHYVKVEMDKIYGYGNFQNEIIWCYRGGGVSKKRFGRKHDVLLWYTNGPKWAFEPQYTEYSVSTKAVTGRTGKRVNQTDIDLERGAHMPDWWADINSLQTWSPDRIGYPTEKPVALLERVVRSMCPPGGLVADFFCGGGATPLATQRLGRRWVATDQSRAAVTVTANRIAAEVQRPPVGSGEIPDFTIQTQKTCDAQKLRAQLLKG